ncbi:penicillin-insensitive murein endopeptidase [Dickeya undicola]|uniref:Penicillin-insensitive murein endopeptidase n=1 Tax=Dickeya undicola TaxID=1577887 RepID=A0A3N0GAM9_9GAMM|nr:penicillin-insensitive murein endopeptidase [Dickeya undicola]RNM09296.1 penicillin-insensitive murein endopeptidase [Dickeya undicola]RNM26868.1 penicillin-insensitive murein endopeptidase [Dickeya undicola]
MKRNWIGMAALLFCSATLAKTPWQAISHPVAGQPQAIGAFANGCIIGAQPLALQSPDYQVMRVDQRRYFGHPDLLAFINRLSTSVHRTTGGTVLIGDMGMPAGGRFSSGHASHQSGLDVDIWLQLPRQRWSQQQLLQPQPLDLVLADGKNVNPRVWSPDVQKLVKTAAQDNDVTRIFVNPAIKKQLCLEAGSDRSWLHKVRPWFAHRAHMHVRLRCPAESLECQEQDAPPAGDGCGAELNSWFQPRKPGAETPIKTPPPPLPPSCQALLDRHLIVE